MRGTWVYRNGRLVEKGGPEDIRVEPQRSSLPAPMLISDTMEPIQSMVDGRFYTSKAVLRASYRAAGVVEVGNDPARLKPKPKPQPNRKAIRQSVEKAFAQHASGVRPMQH
jgi:hypothetical protein